MGGLPGARRSIVLFARYVNAYAAAALAVFVIGAIVGVLVALTAHG